MDGKYSFYTNTKGQFTHSNSFIDPYSIYGNNDSFKRLNSFLAAAKFFLASDIGMQSSGRIACG